MARDDFKKSVETDTKTAALAKYIKKLEHENDRLKEQIGSDQALFESVKDAIIRMEPPTLVNYPIPKLEHSPLSAVLVITDAHAEELVRAAEMEGMASYDFATFLRRMREVAEKAVELTHIMRQASAIPELHIWSLGDWFLGKIHPQDEGYGTTMPMPVAVPKTAIAFGELVRALSGHFESVRVTGMCGNHGRDSQKKSYKMTADRNWDMSVYLIARELLGDCKNVVWDLPESIMHVTEIAGHNVLLTHGDCVSMTSRTPYYGIERQVNLEHKTRRNYTDFDYCFMGHFHHNALIDGDIKLCPGLIGPNQFSQYVIHSDAPSAQLLAFFNEKRGLTTEWPIKLT